jgi:hypothetical protein
LLCHGPGFTGILLKELACKKDVVGAKSANVKLIFIKLGHRDTFLAISVFILILLIAILYLLIRNIRVPS